MDEQRHASSAILNCRDWASDHFSFTSKATRFHSSAIVNIVLNDSRVDFIYFTIHDVIVFFFRGQERHLNMLWRAIVASTNFPFYSSSDLSLPCLESIITDNKNKNTQLIGSNNKAFKSPLRVLEPACLCLGRERGEKFLPQRGQIFNVCWYHAANSSMFAFMLCGGIHSKHVSLYFSQRAALSIFFSLQVNS